MTNRMSAAITPLAVIATVLASGQVAAQTQQGTPAVPAAAATPAEGNLALPHPPFRPSFPTPQAPERPRDLVGLMMRLWERISPMTEKSPDLTNQPSNPRHGGTGVCLGLLTDPPGCPPGQKPTSGEQ
jgi:hypothetical protein